MQNPEANSDTLELHSEKKAPQTFYTVLFNTTYIGRASDLLNSIFRLNPTDEYRLRTTLHSALLAFSNAHSIQEQSDFKSPIVLESSLESDSIILSLQGIIHSKEIHLEEISNHIHANNFENLFEKSIHQIRTHNEKVVIKVHESTRTLEIQTFFKIKQNFLIKNELERKIDVIFIENSPQNNPKKHSYIDLSDIDPVHFLKNEILNVQGSGTPLSDDGFHSVKDSKKNNPLEKVFKLVDGDETAHNELEKKISSKIPIDSNAFLTVTSGAEQLVNHIMQIQSKMNQSEPAPVWVNALLNEVIDYQLKIKQVSEVLQKSTHAPQSIEPTVPTEKPTENTITQTQHSSLANENITTHNVVHSYSPDHRKALGYKNHPEYTQLKEQYNILVHESTEFKKINQLLMQQLDQQATYEEEILIEQAPHDKKLTTAMLLLASSRKETESANKKIEELLANEAKLKSDLEKMHLLINHKDESSIS